MGRRVTGAGRIHVILLLFLVFSGPARGWDAGTSWDRLPKEKKVLAVNLGLGAFITAWGVANWDYFQNSPRWTNEGWFGRNTPEGGADKAGHAYTSYLLSHVLASRYEHWGYDKGDAALYAGLSSFAVQAYMEAGDAFSGRYGFSYEDFLSNAIGSVAGYLSWRYPAIRDKIDFRVEYRPTFKDADVFTDYDHQKYLLAFKLGGFEPFQTGPLSYLELHLGYFARGYDDRDPANDRRDAYVGVALNLSRLFRERGFGKTATVLSYYQPPYTSLDLKHDFNR